MGPSVPKFSATAWAPWGSENKWRGPAYSGFHVIRTLLSGVNAWTTLCSCWLLDVLCRQEWTTIVQSRMRFTWSPVRRTTRVTDGQSVTLPTTQPLTTDHPDWDLTLELYTTQLDELYSALLHIDRRSVRWRQRHLTRPQYWTSTVKVDWENLIICKHILYVKWQRQYPENTRVCDLFLTSYLQTNGTDIYYHVTPSHHITSHHLLQQTSASCVSVRTNVCV